MENLINDDSYNISNESSDSIKLENTTDSFILENKL